MDLDTVFIVLRDLFMSLFIIFFVLNTFSKRSYKIQCYVFITLGVIFSALTWNWSLGFKVGFITLFAMLAIKTISDARKRNVDINADI
ncbi:hypothetical protein CSV61_07910 [Sporosarcina sp. P3]|uniref:hypothetical protein n=1 Tax=Sporosarcina sp. P3 TaxID=2048245 RepID=UPI000C16D5DB|nr:hypothetical protein [Sporosarcina sp. P3]PID21620.1 hypothetical protein CSV61_07910 [Sporosarcina sp. P3]